MRKTVYQKSSKTKCIVPGLLTISARILKCVVDGHFSILWGHGKGFMIGSEAAQLMLVGHIMWP